MSEAALGVMYGLVLEDGKRWGEIAIQQQIEDIEAIFNDDGPNKHFYTRPRGGSKTTDVAGAAISWLAADAPPRSRGYVVASNGEQAGILIDAAASLITRTPELEGYLEIEAEKIIAPNGAWVRVLNLSDSGAWGLRDAHFLICDEFAQWPVTRGAKRVYTAIRSTVQKVRGCKLILLTSAGEPSHWSYPILIAAIADLFGWRVSQMPGPVPWQDPVELEALRNELTPSQYDRLVLNIWSEDEDRAVSEEDFELAAQEYKKVGKGWRIRGPHPFVKYVIAVDIGIINDATVFAVGHLESIVAGERRGPKRIVVDHVERWQGSKKKPIQLAAVEDRCVELSREYNGASLRADPDQFVGNLQSLNRRGVRAKEFVFSSSSVGQIATALVQAFRNQQIQVPGAPELKEELLRVRLRESTPGVTRLDHDRGAHDDQAVTIGLLCHVLLGKLLGGAAVFRQLMENTKERREADASNPETGDPTERRARRDVSRHQRILQTGKARADRDRTRGQRSCPHRWRPMPDGGAFCVFACGATKDVPEVTPPSASLPFTDFLVRTGNPDALDETVQQLGAAVVVDGSWDGDTCTVRVLAGDPGYIKFAIDHQGYGEVLPATA
jgi:hypothetical protein